MGKTKRKRGRPKGSRKGVPNQEYTTVVENRVQCPNCRDTRRTVVRPVPPGRFRLDGQTGDGRAYTHCIKRVVRCGGCGHCYVVFTYERRTAAAESV